jgi:C1A family cysteine protease
MGAVLSNSTQLRFALALFIALVLAAQGELATQRSSGVALAQSAAADTPEYRNSGHAPVSRSVVERANALAARLLELDEQANRQFERQHPGVLPESELRLPKPTAVAFDWCNRNKVSESHRQRNLDCWANAATEALECSYLIRDNRRVVLSTQPVLDHLKLHATHITGSAYKAFDYFLKTGTTFLHDYPYTGKPAEPRNVPLTFRAIAWGFVQTGDETPTALQVKEALLRHGPLAVTVLSTPNFKSYRGGLFHEANPPNENNVKSNHVVLLVGWDDTRGPHGAWKIKNTWGTQWGEDGFMWIQHSSNYICHSAAWVRAHSTFYRLPEEFYRLVPDAKPMSPPHYKP